MNIYDIAKQAGVSIATVSRVLNGNGPVSPATRKKVEQILEKNNYKPSAIARGMVSKSMRTVAVLTVDIRVPHYAQTAHAMEQEFGRRGYEVILCNTFGNEATALQYLKAVIEKQVDGIILVGSVFNEIGRGQEFETLLKQVPVVLANGSLEIPNAHSVLVDDVKGVKLAVEHLVSQGRRQLIYVKDKDTASAKAKADGFMSAVTGLRGVTGTVIYTEDTLESAIRAAEELTKSGKMMDGIVCGEDLIAVGIIKGLTRAGVHVPENVAVTGFNNSMYGKLCEPELTSVDNKPELVAMECVRLLEALINGEGNCKDITILPELKKGRST